MRHDIIPKTKINKYNAVIVTTTRIYDDQNINNNININNTTATTTQTIITILHTQDVTDGMYNTGTQTQAQRHAQIHTHNKQAFSSEKIKKKKSEQTVVTTKLLWFFRQNGLVVLFFLFS